MPTVHYGSHGQAECGADYPNMQLSEVAAHVTCPTCRGWLPIVAASQASAAAPDVERLTKHLLERADEIVRCLANGWYASHPHYLRIDLRRAEADHRAAVDALSALRARETALQREVKRLRDAGGHFFQPWQQAEAALETEKQRHAPLVAALQLAGFYSQREVPLQHDGPCAFWHHEPCNCPISKIEAALTAAAAPRLETQQEQ